MAPAPQTRTGLPAQSSPQMSHRATGVQANRRGPRQPGMTERPMAPIWLLPTMPGGFVWLLPAEAPAGQRPLPGAADPVAGSLRAGPAAGQPLTGAASWGSAGASSARAAPPPPPAGSSGVWRLPRRPRAPRGLRGAAEPAPRRGRAGTAASSAARKAQQPTPGRPGSEPGRRRHGRPAQSSG